MEWIDIEKQKPPLNTRIMMRNPDKWRGYGEFTSDKRCWLDAWVVYRDAPHPPTDRPTQWMPLPEAPRD